MERMSDCELIVMHCLWGHSDHEMVLSEIVEDIFVTLGRKWNPNTVSTFLSRLVRKGYLTSHKKGRYYFYHIMVTEMEYKSMVISEQVELWSKGDVTEYIDDVLSVQKLTKEQIEKIERKLETLK